MKDIKSSRNDLIKNPQFINSSKKTHVDKYQVNNNIYHKIYFNNTNNKERLIEILIKEIKFFLNNEGFNNNYFAFIVGLGNEEHTADAIGPKVVKKVNSNAYLKEFGINTNKYIATLEPGVLGTTGIDTKRIVESVSLEIKPDFAIIIDAFVTDDINEVNHTIIISNDKITPGSGIKGINTEISKDTLGIPVIIIGIPTAVEIKKNKNTYLLTSSSVDEDINQLSYIISCSLNRTFTK